MGKFLTAIGSWLGAIVGFDWLWEQLRIEAVPVVWAFTVATFFAIAYLGLWLCGWKISIYETRIEQCAEAKQRLEEQILKNRLSSGNRS